MADCQSPGYYASVIPPAAHNAWLALSELLAAVGTVPCRTSDPEAWWPERRDLDSPPSLAAVCRRCPSRDSCLTYALAADEREGIWGGMTRAERLQASRADVA